MVLRLFKAREICVLLVERLPVSVVAVTRIVGIYDVMPIAIKHLVISGSWILNEVELRLAEYRE